MHLKKNIKNLLYTENNRASSQSHIHRVMLFKSRRKTISTNTKKTTISCKYIDYFNLPLPFLSSKLFDLMCINLYIALSAYE